MKKALFVLALCGFNLAIAADKTTFLKKFERKITAATSNFRFDKKVSANITVEVTPDGKSRVVKMECANSDDAHKLKIEIEKMLFSDSTCAGTHTMQLNIQPQQ